MSTKTSIKRIALVAAAALTLGGFSAVSASAATSAPTPGTAGFYYQTAYNTTTGAAVAGGYAVVVFVPDTATNSEVWNITSSGVGSISNASVYTGSNGVNAAVGGGALTFPATSVQYTDSSSASSAATQNLVSDTLTVSSSVTGTQTLTATKLVNGVPSTSVTTTITWLAATSTSVSAQYTTYGMAAGTGGPVVGTVATVTADKAAQTAAANRAATIYVDPRDGGNNDLASTEKLTAVITGPGTLGINATVGSAASSGRAITGAAGADTITVFGDGTAGVSTITISDGSVTLATFTVTFTGSVAAVKATQNLYVAKAGATLGVAQVATPAADTVAHTDAVTLSVTDSAGNNTASGIAGTIKVVPADLTVIASGSCTEETVTTGVFHCSVTAAAGAASGASTTVTFGALTSDGVTYAYSAPVTFKIGGAIKTDALSLDAASYAPNAPVVLTFTAKDSAGNAPYDQDAALFSVAGTSTAYLGGNVLPGIGAYTLINGKHDFKGNYAPVAGDKFTISATDATTALTVLSASAAVTGSSGGDASLALDAANAATDAANNAYDEAQNATQAASDALAAVKALAVQVKALIALVTKIKNKVGA